MPDSNELSAAGSRDFAWIVVAYLAAVFVAGLSIWLWPAGAMPDWAPGRTLFLAGVADVAATLVVFAFSVAFRNSSFYDAYWSVAPLMLLGYWYALAGGPADIEGGGQILRASLVSVLVVLWSVRLTGNWARGWRGLDFQDWRYQGLQEQLGSLYWPVSFAGIHFMPTVLVFLGSLPIWVVARSDLGVGWLDALAALVGFSAVWVEYQSDEELRDFKRRHTGAAEVMNRGWWARCRHPNYLGEIGFWVALLLFGVAAGGAWYLVLPGAVAIVALFVFVSIPMLEHRELDTKPAYHDYQESTPMLLPSLRRGARRGPERARAKRK